MKNLVWLLVLAAFTMSGCAALDYFKKADNQENLVKLGITCFESKDYTIGIEYGLTRDGEEITNATQVGGIIGCDNKKFSVICDVTKGPDENPCSDVKSYTEDPPSNSAPAAEPVIEEPVVEPAVEEPVEVKPEPVTLAISLGLKMKPAEMWC